ncbi:MAG: hypothetical protein ACI4SG_07615 [Oligosphaeraceae bacterium]
MKKFAHTLVVFALVAIFCGAVVAAPPPGGPGRPGPGGSGRPPASRNYGRPAPPPPPAPRRGHSDHHHDHGPSRGWWNGALVVGATLGLLDIATRGVTETRTVEHTTVIQPAPVQQPTVIYAQPAQVQQPTVIYAQPAQVQQPAVIYTQPATTVTPASVIYR